MIHGNVAHLEEYLGFSLDFEIDQDVHIKRTKRSCTYCDWDNFFIRDDVEIFRTMLEQYMSLRSYGGGQLNEKELELGACHIQYAVDRPMDVKLQLLSILFLSP